MSALHTALTSANDFIVLAGNLPNPGPQAPEGLEGPMTTLLGNAKWVALIFCLIAVLLVGAGLAWAHNRQENSEHVERLLKVLLGVFLIGAGGSAFAAFL